MSLRYGAVVEFQQGAQTQATTHLTACLQRAQTAIATLDARLTKKIKKTATLNSKLKAEGIELTSTLSALLQRSVAATASMDAVIVTSGGSVFATIDAKLRKSLTKTATLDAKLYGRTTTTATLSAVLKGVNTATASMDAVIRKFFAGTPDNVSFVPEENRTVYV